MIRAHITRESGGQATYLAKHRLAKLPSSHLRDSSSEGGLDRCLYDNAAYIQYLETQLKRVTAASEQAENFRESTQALNDLVEKMSDRVTALDREFEERYSSRQDALCNQLTSLEVKLEQQDQSYRRELQRQEERQRHDSKAEVPAAIQDRIKTMEETVRELQMRLDAVECQRGTEINGLEARLEAVEKANAELSARCRGLEAAQVEGLAGVRSELSGDMERLRHDVSMGDHRILSSCSKQGELAQEEMGRLREELMRLQREVVRREGHLPPREGSSSASRDYTAARDSSGLKMGDAGEGSAAMEQGKKLRVLTAAFHHAEEAHRRRYQEQRAMLDKMQKILTAVGVKALETASSQAEAVLSVVGQLEERVACMEAEQEEQRAWRRPRRGGAAREKADRPTIAPGTAKAACFHESSEEPADMWEAEGVRSARRGAQGLEEDERVMEEELVQATAAVLAVGSIMGTQGCEGHEKRGGSGLVLPESEECQRGRVVRARSARGGGPAGGRVQDTQGDGPGLCRPHSHGQSRHVQH